MSMPYMITQYKVENGGKNTVEALTEKAALQLGVRIKIIS